MIPVEQLPAAILEYRAVHNITLSQFADLCKLTYPVVSDIERGKRLNIRRHTQARISAVLEGRTID